MEFTAIALVVVIANILLWFFIIHQRPQSSDDKQLGFQNISPTVNGADKNVTRNAKRNRRNRKKKLVAKSGGTKVQDLTLDIDCPITTGQTVELAERPCDLPFDTCELIRDTSCSSKLAKGPLIAVANEETHANDTPSGTGEAVDVAEKPRSTSSDKSKRSRDIPNLVELDPVVTSGEDDGRTTTLRYIARSEIRRIAGKGGRITKFLERRYGVQIDLPQGDNGNIVISGGNETTRLAVEASISDRLIMTITLPNVDEHARMAIQKWVDLGKLKILNKSFQRDQESVTFTGLTRDCKVFLDVPKCH